MEVGFRRIDKGRLKYDNILLTIYKLLEFTYYFNYFF